MLLIKIGSIHFWLWLDLKGLKSVVIYYGIYLGFADKRMTIFSGIPAL